VPVLAIDPETPTTLYAVTDGERVFKSTDAGGTWSDATTAPLPEVRVWNPIALALDPTTPGTLYAATAYRDTGCDCGPYYYGLFKSTNAGGTWSAITTGLQGSGRVRTLALDPTTPGTLYVAIGGWGVNKSTDGGNNWSAFSVGLASDVNALVVDPTMPGRLYAGTGGGGVFEIEQVQQPSCFGDCSRTASVAVNDIITLVDIALGTAQPSACADGVPIGGDVTVAVIIQAVNNALSGCPVPPTPTITPTSTITPTPTITATPTRVGFCGDMHSTCTPTPTAAH